MKIAYIIIALSIPGTLTYAMDPYTEKKMERQERQSVRAFAQQHKSLDADKIKEFIDYLEKDNESLKRSYPLNPVDVEMQRDDLVKNKFVIDKLKTILKQRQTSLNK